MSSSSSRQLAHRLLVVSRSSTPSRPIRAPCPACAVLQARAYAHSARPQRTKKIISEFSSVPQASSSSQSQASTSASRPSASSSTDCLLKARFISLFPSRPLTTTTQFDPQQVIQAAYPLIFRRGLRELLDPHLSRISSLLSGYTTSDHEERRMISTLLGHCFYRTMTGKNKLSMYDEEQIQNIADNYADFIVRETQLVKTQGGPEERFRSLYQLFEEGLARLAKTSSYRVRLPPSIAAAWTILRVELDIIDSPQLPFVWPPAEELEAYLRKSATTLGEDTNKYVEGISTLLRHTSEVERLPPTKEALATELTDLRARGDVDGLIRLWTRFRDRLATSAPQTTQEGPIFSSDSDTRNAILALFLRTFKRPLTGTNRTSSTQQSLGKYADQVLAFCPRPLPRHIAYTLLAVRARPNDKAFQTGQEVASLDHEDERDYKSDTSGLDNLKATWREIQERDVKMYMMYIEGLGRWGDLEGLQVAWNELVEDKKCKELYYVEEGKGNLSGPFPPVQALNHMISAALLVPSTGPAVAINLFEQASQPNSSVPCNLITINTMLRHHARQADIQSMTSLFALADKLNLKPDVVTYTTLIQGLLRAGRIDLAKATLMTMHSQGITPNERMCSMLIADLAKSGTQTGLRHAEDLLKLMLQKGLRTNEVTWTALIAGYFRGGWEKDGWDAVDRMTRAGHRLNRIGYNVLFKQIGHGGGGGGEGIMELWRKMIREGVVPNSDSYLLVLTPFVREHKWDEVDEILGEMKKRGFRPEKGALSRLIGSISARR
ncbi:hypothetical protein CI109_106062 [Kwoniella shandongensis]|uniref:Uncharacterized protein n=1 Tax=Kwoniella shandongensis TaxID=1734106 RepID=A0A5M6BXS2_9TREE|nr:uncharacterized protein CI109_003883 [Kwoniella shandongensis]KAA5527624.1 hypothetical protein CI109_003883 [Kwoniella shandongensis]